MPSRPLRTKADGECQTARHDPHDARPAAARDLESWRLFVWHCAESEQCSCVTYAAGADAAHGSCWRRSACEPAGFQKADQYDTYTKAKGFVKWPATNCFHGPWQQSAPLRAARSADPNHI